jgi:hypothetical protein
VATLHSNTPSTAKKPTLLHTCAASALLNDAPREDIDWGARLALHTTPEENAFVGVRFLKEKSLDSRFDAAVAEVLRTWLLQEGLGTIVTPEALPREYWIHAANGAS